MTKKEEKEKSNLHPVFKDICDSFQRDYSRAVDREMNDSEHQRLYERRGL